MRTSRLFALGMLGLVLIGCDAGSSRKGRARDVESEESEEEEAPRKASRKKKRAGGAEEDEGARPPRPTDAPRPVAVPNVPGIETAFVPPAPRPPDLVAPGLTPPPPPPAFPLPPAPSPTAAPSEDRAKTRRWVVEVTLGSEFAGTGDWHREVARRWTKPVRVSVMQGDPSLRADLRDVVATIDEILRPLGVPVTLVGDQDATAEMRVHYARSADLPGIAQANGFAYVPGNAGFFYRTWNARGELQRAYVLLATDLLSGASLRHFTFEEVTQAMGPANDSPLYADSVFYGLGADGGEASTLAARDRKLLAFLYGHVQPGQGRAQVEATFEAHWR